MQGAVQAFFSRAGVVKSSLLQHVRVLNPALRPLVFSRSESVSSARIEEHGFEHTTIADVLTSKGKSADGSWLWCTTQDTVYDAVQSMTQHNVGALVVVKPGEQQSVAGIITERGICFWLYNLPRVLSSLRFIGQLSVSSVSFYRTPSKRPISTSLANNRKQDLIKTSTTDPSQLAVSPCVRVGVGVGTILLRYDYLRKIIVQGRSSKSTKVGDIMTEELQTYNHLMKLWLQNKLITVTPDTKVLRAMQLMTENRIRHIPVVNDKGMIGMVSIGDVVRAVVSEHREELDRLNAFIQGGY
ncbi:unnamed protein product [Linum tenue]|uniref:CBS domain-containing protein n=1 Tax=Linum tenue TaxID=586396 RepID=A0AAV0RSG0_9ROSI|nr:unnamed protein product [Linum tenue]